MCGIKGRGIVPKSNSESLFLNADGQWHKLETNLLLTSPMMVNLATLDLFFVGRWKSEIHGMHMVVLNHGQTKGCTIFGTRQATFCYKAGGLF